jgi:hypothetical protein
MAEAILMPRLFETMTKGEVSSWHKKVGDQVKRGDLIAEIDCETATMELESYQEGYVLYLGAKANEYVEVNDLLLIVGRPGEEIESLISKHSKKDGKGQRVKILSEEEYRAVKEESKLESSDRTSQKTIIIIEKANKFIINEDVEGVIGVNEESKEMADLLGNLKLEQGMMVGLFGQWGRGKTFFWKKVWEKLEKKETNPFYKVEFHAWKYQDTPASWAYLYERLSDEYIKSSTRFKLFRWFEKYYKIFRLNFNRKGTAPLLKFLLLILIGIASFLLMHSFAQSASKELENIVNYLGLPITLLFTLYQIIIYLRKEYSTKAKDLFLKYSQQHSFKEHLGLQAEIQKEILILLKSWITKRKIGKKES